MWLVHKGFGGHEWTRMNTNPNFMDAGAGNIVGAAYEVGNALLEKV
jgi:hypothetical protein